MSCPGGTEPILSSRMPHKGVTGSQASQQCQDEALKLHELHAKKLPGQFPSAWEAEWKLFSSVRTWQTQLPSLSAQQECRTAAPQGWCSLSLSYPVVAAPPLLTAGGNSHGVCTLMLLGPKNMAIGSQVSGSGVRRMGFDYGKQPDLHRMYKPERAQRGQRKKRTGTVNDLAKMDSVL